jgi:hypothetical protein
LPVEQWMVTALLVPSDLDRPVALLDLEDSSRVFSGVLGGGVLDDTSALTHGGDVVAVYLTAERLRLPDNPRAAVLAPRVGLYARNLLAGLRGDVLLTGRDPMGADIDLPDEVLQGATQAGIMPRATAAPVRE